MAQYGWQNTVACVGKWLQSNVWNHLSSGRVWKMTVLCILQKSLLIDFIYLGGGVTVTDGRDNWGKKWILCIILTSCSGWGYWHLLKGPCWMCLTAASATAHSQRLTAFFWVSAGWVLRVVLPLVPGTFWKLWFAEVCNLPKAWLIVCAVTEEGG